MTQSAVQISVVVPLFNEDESLPELSEWIAKVMRDNNFTYEILFIDDGSRDNSWQVIETLSLGNPHIRGFRFVRNYGKTAALQTGFQAARGDVIITMDADLQDSPDEIPELYHMITTEKYTAYREETVMEASAQTVITTMSLDGGVGGVAY